MTKPIQSPSSARVGALELVTATERRNPSAVGFRRRRRLDITRRVAAELAYLAAFVVGGPLVVYGVYALLSWLFPPWQQ